MSSDAVCRSVVVCRRTVYQASYRSMLQRVVACCSVLQRVALRCSVLQRVAWSPCRVLQRVIVCCSVLHFVAAAALT